MKRRWRVVWIERVEHDYPYQVVRDARLPLGSLYLVPEHVDASELWGDDWDDAPEWCNAGPPYRAIRLDLSYGDVLELVLDEEQFVGGGEGNG